MMNRAPGFRSGLVAAIPIVMGYLPIAFSFGVAASNAGLSMLEATFMSFVVYSGAAQFLALALIVAGAPVLIAVATLTAMNLRHLLYGPALMKEADKDASRKYAWAWGWGLTDEVFGQSLGALARGQRFSERYMFGIGVASYLSWVIGTLLGVMAGGGALEAYPAVNAALHFMLAALFLSLWMSILSRGALPAIVVAALATIIGTIAVSGTVGLLAGMICGALAGVLRK